MKDDPPGLLRDYLSKIAAHPIRLWTTVSIGLLLLLEWDLPLGILHRSLELLTAAPLSKGQAHRLAAVCIIGSAVLSAIFARLLVSPLRPHRGTLRNSQGDLYCPTCSRFYPPVSLVEPPSCWPPGKQPCGDTAGHLYCPNCRQFFRQPPKKEAS